LAIAFKNVDRTLKFIEIYELRGKKIFETQNNNGMIILNIENYPTGIYIVKVKTAGSNWIGKFCKE
jgi:tRNA A37 N6-isopentenylltransferase MiaA